MSVVLGFVLGVLVGTAAASVLMRRWAERVWRDAGGRRVVADAEALIRD